MNLLNKLTIKNLKLNKKRSIVTIIGITLSIALLTALSSMYVSFVDSTAKYEILEKGNYHVAFQDVPVLNIKTLSNNTKIEEISIVKNLGYSRLFESKNEYKPYVYLKAYDKNALDNLIGILKEGRLPENNNEVVIPEHLKGNGRVNYKVGDKITLNIGKRVSNGGELTQINPFAYENNEKIVDTEEMIYTIVGIVSRPPNSVEEYTAPGYTFITFLEQNELNEKVDIFVLYNEKGVKDYLKVTANIIGVNEKLFAKANDQELSLYMTEKEHQEYKEAYANAKYKLGETNIYLIKLQINPLLLSENQSIGMIVLVVVIIIIVSSVFCIKNSFDISITEKVKQYGMLKSIGATKKQIKRNVLFEGFALGVISIPLGILSGLVAGYLLIIISNILLTGSITEGYTLMFSVSIPAILISIILGLVTIYFSAIKSARKASKVSPIESIRNSGNIKIRSKKLKTSKVINKLFGIGGVISLKNIKRNKKRYRTTIISLTISIATFIGLSYFTTEMNKSLQQQFSSYDYNYTYSVDQYKDYLDEIEATINLDDIESYALVRDTNVPLYYPKYNKLFFPNDMPKDESTLISIATFGEEEYGRYLKRLGLNSKDVEDKVILYDSTIMYKEEKGRQKQIKTTRYDYKKGDKITIEVFDDVTQKKDKLEVEIAMITDEEPMGMGIHNALLIVSDEFFDNNNLDTPDMNVYFNSKDADKLEQEVEDIFGDIEYDERNVDAFKKQEDNVMLLINIFLYGFITVISLIGVTNIFNTITTSMSLRKREFAVLKSIGMTSKEFNRMINLESIFIGSKSLIYGTIIGTIITLIIYKINEVDTRYCFPIIPFTLCVIVVFVLITILMKYGVNKINKQNIIETIRNENI